MPSNGRLRPLCIQVHARDNVAIIANEGGLPAGAQLDNGLALDRCDPGSAQGGLMRHCGRRANPALWRRYRLCRGADRQRQLGARGGYEFAGSPAAG